MVIISPKNIKKSYYEFCILLTRTLVNLRSSSIWSAGIGSFERTLALTLLVLKRSTGGGELSTTLAPLTLAELPIMTTTAPNTRPGSLGFRRERKYRKKGEKQKNHIAAIWGSRKSRPSAPPAMQQVGNLRGFPAENAAFQWTKHSSQDAGESNMRKLLENQLKTVEIIGENITATRVS